MGALRDQLDEEPEIGIVSEGMPGDHEDISGFDPMDYGDTPGANNTPPDVAQELWTEDDADNLNEPVAAPQAGAARAPQVSKADNATYAQLRIQQRENRILRERFDQLINALNANAQPEEEDQEEDQVAFEDDPLTNLKQNLTQIDRKLTRQEEETKHQQDLDKASGYLRDADAMTNDAIAKIGPDVWNAAMTHLANVRIEDYVERNPHLTREEASIKIGNAIVREKIQLVAQGRNPAEVYLKDAIRFGFRSNRQAPAPAAPSPKNEVRRQNERDKTTGRTISSVTGSPAKQRLSAQTSLGMDDRQWRDTIDDVMKERGTDKLSMRDFIQPNR